MAIYWASTCCHSARFGRGLLSRLTCLVLTLLILHPSLALAQTPFFSARGKHDRCAALEAWYAELLKTWPGIEAMRMGPQMQTKAARVFQDDVFIRYFGKPFFSLSEGDKKAVHQALEKCFAKNSFAAQTISIPFNYQKIRKGYTYEHWIQQIEAMRDERASQPVAGLTQVDAPNALADEPGERKPFVLFGAGEKILSTATYRAYKSYGCTLNVVLRDPETPLGEHLIELARRELLPVLEKQQGCESQHGKISFFFELPVFESFANPSSQRDARERDVRAHDTLTNLNLKREAPVFLLLFSHPKGEAYRFHSMYFDQLALDIDYAYSGDPALNSLEKIKAYVADPGAKSPAVVEMNRKGEEVRKRVAQARDAKHQEALRATRVAQRHEAASILTSLADLPLSPPNHDFSRYRNSELMSNIYTGNFEVFVGDHSPNAKFNLAFQAAIALGAMVGNRNWKAEQNKITVSMAKMKDLAQRRGPLTLAVMAYHEEFSQACRKSRSPFAWVKLKYQRNFVQKRFGVETTLFEGDPDIIDVREPYVEIFDDAYRFAADPGFIEASAFENGIARSEQTMSDDFALLLRTEGCTSPVVRMFEVNLYLAFRWFTPAQQLRAPDP